MNHAPLEDMRIVAIEQFGAGPFGTLQLADLGADVIKIEDPSVGGDVSRYVPPFQTGESSLYFESFNRNKRSISLDLRRPETREVFEDLVRASDAVFSNLRGDQPSKLRIRYSDLKRVNPAIVCCSLSGFGTAGPRAREGAYDWTVQGLAGWQSLTGEPGGPPTKSGLSLADYCGGYVAAIAILAGVHRARRDGHGSDVDLSLFEVALAQLAYVATWVASAGYEPVRRANSAHQSMVPFQNFQTLDGWIVIACPKQSLWERLCRGIGMEELLEDNRFSTFALRDANRDALLDVLGPAFRTRTTAQWLSSLASEGVPCAPVNDVAAALADPQVEARGGILEVDHPELGRVRGTASPFSFDDFRPPARRGPFRGEDTASIVREICGYSDDKFEALRREGVFGDLALNGDKRGAGA